MAAPAPSALIDFPESAGTGLVTRRAGTGSARRSRPISSTRSTSIRSGRCCPRRSTSRVSGAVRRSGCTSRPPTCGPTTCVSSPARSPSRCCWLRPACRRSIRLSRSTASTTGMAASGNPVLEPLVDGCTDFADIVLVQVDPARRAAHRAGDRKPSQRNQLQRQPDARDPRDRGHHAADRGRRGEGPEISVRVFSSHSRRGGVQRPWQSHLDTHPAFLPGCAIPAGKPPGAGSQSTSPTWGAGPHLNYRPGRWRLAPARRVNGQHLRTRSTDPDNARRGRNGTTVSRYWSGRKALLLCGGSRGAMEVGFYQALTECGVRADMVLGSSIAERRVYRRRHRGTPAYRTVARVPVASGRVPELGLAAPWGRSAGLLLARPATGHAAPNLAGHAIRAARDPAHDRHHRSAVGFRVLLVRTGDLIGPDRLDEPARHLSPSN